VRAVAMACALNDARFRGNALSIWLRSRSVRLLCVAESATSWGITGPHPEPRHTTSCAASQGGPHLPLASCMAAEQRRHRHLTQMDSPFNGKEACASVGAGVCPPSS
jgi:hypothetical protein